MMYQVTSGYATALNDQQMGARSRGLAAELPGRLSMPVRIQSREVRWPGFQ
jgi:hypothetical protein